MAQPYATKSMKPKKRWRIGGVLKSKKKELPTEDDAETIPTTPDSSDGCSDSVEENPIVMGSQPIVMSDVDNSDSDDDDLYLDNDKDDSKGNKIQKYGSSPQSKRDNDDDDDDDWGDERSSNYNTPSSSSKQESSNTDDDDKEDSESSFEDNMYKHRLDRRDSPHYSSELSKICEKDEEIRTNTSDEHEKSNPIDTRPPPFHSRNNHHQNKPNIDDDDDDDEFDTLEECYDKEVPKTKLADQHAVPVLTTPMPQVIDGENYTDSNGIEINLPTHRGLSKELCKIVAMEHYSSREQLLALERMSKWAQTQDSNYLKHFLTYGGVVKVIDFLCERIEDASCQWEFLMELIHKSADVICNVCFVGKHGINEDIAVVNATVVVKYGGIETLLMANNVYNKSDASARADPLALKAMEAVWNAIMNVYCNAEAAVTKAISLMVLDYSIETLSTVGAIDHPIAAETLANVFNSLYRITYHDYVTKEVFQEKKLLVHCLSVFKRDVTSSDGDEELLEEAFSFLYGCHEKELLEKGRDYERVLPLCVMGLREFAYDNENIRQWATKLLDGACSNIENKDAITMAEGAIEVLAPFLTHKDVDAEEKQELRNLIRKIVAV